MSNAKAILISEQSNGNYQIYLNTNLNTIFDVPAEIIRDFVDQIWAHVEKYGEYGKYIKYYNNQEDNENV